MASVANTKNVGPEFKKDLQLVRVVYDYAVDGGAIGNLTLLTATGACVVKMNHLDVKTGFTSAGAIEVSVGKGAGGVEFLSAALKATLVANYVVGSSSVVKLAAGDVISLGLAAFSGTAGKVEFVFDVMAV